MCLHSGAYGRAGLETSSFFDHWRKSKQPQRTMVSSVAGGRCPRLTATKTSIGYETRSIGKGLKLTKYQLE
jgi:hypothetical protein